MVEIKFIKNGDTDTEQQYRDLLQYCFGANDGYKEMAFPLREHEQLIALYDDGIMAAALTVVFFDTTVFGDIVLNAGISSVATWPQYRNLGYVRQLKDTVFAYIQERGASVTSLYTFKFSFYEKLGYGYIGGHNDFILAPENFKKLDDHGCSVKMYNGRDDHFKQIREIHNAWAKNYQFGVQTYFESVDHFNAFVKFNKGSVFLFYDREANPVGYMMVEIQETGLFERRLEIKRIAWLNKDVIDAMFAFAGSHRNQCKTVRWMAPVNFPFWLYTKEVRIEQHVYYQWMARPIGVAKLLEQKALFQGFSGNAEFSVFDEQISENSGTWRVENGKVTKSDSVDKDAVPMYLFSSLLFGHISLQHVIDHNVLPENYSDETKAFFPHYENIFVTEYY